MTAVTLDQLQHSDDRKGPWCLYVYEADGQHHRGGTWFQDSPKYPEEGEITTREAQTRCILAVTDHREVRVTDGGDMLVFHFDGEKVVHGQSFWNEVCP